MSVFNSTIESIALKTGSTIHITPPADSTRKWIVRVDNDYAIGNTLEEALALLFDKLNA